MEKREKIGFVTLFVLAAVFFGGCAGKVTTQMTAEQIPLTEKKQELRICSDSPLKAAARFIDCVVDKNLGCLKSLVYDPTIDGILTVFGGGNKEMGQRNASEFYQHPEALKGKDVGLFFEVRSMEKNGKNEYDVVIERTAEIRNKNDDDDKNLLVEVALRKFSAGFEERGNCLTNVRTVDAEWIITKVTRP